MATATLYPIQTLLDNADALGQWSADRGFGGPDTELFREGTGSMYCTIQAQTNADEIILTKTTGTWDLSNTHIRLWQFFTAVGVLQSSGTGGLQIGVSDASNTGWWYVGGSDTYDGGWVLHQVDTRKSVNAGTKPTMTAITDVRLKTVVSTSPKNATNCWTDYWHATDRGYAVTGGTPSDKVTWADVALADNLSYGITQNVNGVYFVNSEVQIGGSGITNMDWTSETVSFPEGLVDAGLYKVKASGEHTVLDITGGSVFAVNQRFQFDMGMAGSGVQIDGLTVQRAGPSTFNTNQTVNNTKFTNCGFIHTRDSTFTNNTIADTIESASGSLIITDQYGTSNWSGLSFISGGTGHAMYIQDSGYYNLDDFTYTGYGANLTSDAVVLNDSGGSVVLSYTDGDTPTYQNGRTGSSTSVTSSVTITINVNDEAGDPVNNAQVAIYDSNDTQIMNEDTVAGVATESYSGTTPTTVTVRVRKGSSTDSPKYIPVSTSQEIGTGGLTLTVTLVEDTNNNS